MKSWQAQALAHYFYGGAQTFLAGPPWDTRIEELAAHPGSQRVADLRRRARRRFLRKLERRHHLSRDFDV